MNDAREGHGGGAGGAGAPNAPHAPRVRVQDLGRISYAAAYAIQCAEHARVLQAREDAAAAGSTPREAGTIFLLEHVPAVITVSRRPGSGEHVLASAQRLASLGVERVETDRGGDVTWHGPGQIVAYLVLDLNVLGLRVHGYLRMLEDAVIAVLGDFGLAGERDPGATGVWIGGAKVCAMGVRLSRWISMHGLALNVQPDLGQFGLIVPCGLHGRPVTSLRAQLGDAAPSVDAVRAALARRLVECVERTAAGAA